MKQQSQNECVNKKAGESNHPYPALTAESRHAFLLAFLCADGRENVGNEKMARVTTDIPCHASRPVTSRRVRYSVRYRSHASFLQGNGGRHTSRSPVSLAKHPRLISSGYRLSSMNSSCKTRVLRISEQRVKVIFSQSSFLKRV
jgi:hypothetical protein